MGSVPLLASVISVNAFANANAVAQWERALEDAKGRQTSREIIVNTKQMPRVNGPII